MSEGNFIQLHRKILDWGWYKDTATKTLFIHCLLKANWKPSEFLGVQLKSGEFATSIPHLAAETGLSVKNVRTALSHLKMSGEVAVKWHGKFSVITVSKWTSYQVKWQTGGRQVAGNGQTGGTNRINKESNKGNNIAPEKSTLEILNEAFPDDE